MTAPGPSPAPGHGDSPASPPGMDVGALARHLREVSPERFGGRLEGRLISGGRSNLTYQLSVGRARWVLRRPPLGHVLETAHDMSREYRVMSALAGTDVPVPEMVTLCADPSVLGAPFFVMSFVDGAIYRHDEQLAAVDRVTARALADRLVDVLASLHRVDVAAVGLAGLGRPEGYLGRQVARWGKQLASSRSRDVPGLDELGVRLAASVPRESGTGLVHGDFKLDNVVVDESGPSISAVLDWEMATLGDPLTDLVNLLLWWDGVRDTDGRPFAPVPADLDAFPSSSDLAELYARATGTELSGLDWYLGLACYKLASIFEGMYLRETRGLTVGEGFDGLAGLAPALAARGLTALREGLA